LFKTLPENSSICRFTWEHFQNINRILQQVQHTGGTFSAAKSHICVSSAVVVGHLYTYEGHLPDTAHIQKIVDWLICKLLTEVQGFLGTVGTIWIFIKDYATIACLLVHITQKDIEFTFGKQELEAMKKLKILAKKLTCNLCNQLCKWTQSHTCYEYILHCCQIYSFSNWG